MLISTWYNKRRELSDPSETLSLTYWCGNNARAAAALCFGLEDAGGTTG
nr:MAG TPA: hypothetical protein [Caudoviricetes sp.]